MQVRPNSSLSSLSAQGYRRTVVSSYTVLRSVVALNRTLSCALRIAPHGRESMALRVVAVEASCVAGSMDEQVLKSSPIEQSIVRLPPLIGDLSKAKTNEDKVSVLMAFEAVAAFMQDLRNESIVAMLQKMPVDQQHLLLCLPAIGQGHVMTQREAASDEELRLQLVTLSSILQRVEVFYDGIGGIVGYHLKSLQLISASGKQELLCDQQRPETSFVVPRAVDLTGEHGEATAREAVAQGLIAMPGLAEVYPVGGAGDRLGLKCDVTGEALPAAMLLYCGRTMLEGLLRDLQAREFLYFKLTGIQLTTPVAIMTSDAKGNHSHISNLFKEMQWFGRGQASFKLFRQPLVPVISVEDGQWLLADPLKPMLKPGGHGAIWKLMLDEGVFDWMLTDCSRKAALVRQISNPMAGTDSTLLALAGCGASRGASFGFMSCDRHVGAAEGMNVMQQQRVWSDGGWKYSYGVTNIEYTEFERLGITDKPVDGCSSTSVFPANTNVLYVGLLAAVAVVQEAVTTGCSEKLMPGLIFNSKKTVSYVDPLSGAESKVRAGRMECTMQNMADFMVDRFDEPLDLKGDAGDRLSTFLVYNSRKKVTSSAKKKREAGAVKIAQTPDGSFFDLQRNALQVLQLCGMTVVPQLGTVEQYLKEGPGFIFLFHPALGPLWSIISQKIRGGSMTQRSELVLEVSELQMQDVNISGSMHVRAENVMGGMANEHSSQELNSAPMRDDHDGYHDSFATFISHSKSGPLPLGRDAGSSKDSMDSINFLDSLTSADLGEALDRNGDEDATGSGAGEGEGQQRLRYGSSACGRVRLSNVTVLNRGVNWEATDNLYWKHKVSRHEALTISLLGRSEFEAHDVTLAGNWSFEVPPGQRMVVSEDGEGKVTTTLSPLTCEEPSWQWQYKMAADGSITLEC